MRTKLMLVGGIATLALTACFGTEVPAQSPTKNPLDDAPPAEAKPSAPAVAPEDVAQKKGKFDEDQAKVALGRAAKNAHSCIDVAQPDAPRGDTTVTVTFSGTGKSTKATVPAPYDGTSMGQCATRAFVGIIVPPFEGDDVTRDFKIDLSPDEKEKAAGKPAPKKK